jgi:putative transposase
MAKRYTAEQITEILKEYNEGAKQVDICRKHQITSKTLLAWKEKYGSMSGSEAKRLRELEAENRRLKEIVADQ